jgi:hypothetical protein
LASEKSSEKSLSTLEFFLAEVSTYAQQGSDDTSVSTAELGTHRLLARRQLFRFIAEANIKTLLTV